MKTKEDIIKSLNQYYITYTSSIPYWFDYGLNRTIEIKKVLNKINANRH